MSPAEPRRWLPHDPILIAGGGIGGLATALALARRQIPSRVLERRPQFGEDGAGIQLGPNATRVLTDLGVAPTLARNAGVPQAIRVHDGTDGRSLARLPLGDWIARRHGAPYWVAHRRDLHDALRSAAEASPLITLETGAGVAAIAFEADSVRVSLETGGTRVGAALIAADGLWSLFRSRELGVPRPTFSGKRAIRAVVPAAALPCGEGTPAASLTSETFVWLKSDAHVVHYPVRDGREIAVVGIFEETTPGEDWSVPVADVDVAARVAGFARPVRELFAAGEGWRSWALHAVPPLTSWTRDRLALLGDAAHPMLPFLAQGAVMALEDAVVLAGEIARAATADAIPAALEAYARQRRPRTAAVQSASRANGRIYHLAGPMAQARNLTLGLVSGERLMTRYDWLYGWQAPA